MLACADDDAPSWGLSPVRVADHILLLPHSATLAAGCLCKWTAARILLPRENDGDDAAGACLVIMRITMWE